MDGSNKQQNKSEHKNHYLYISKREKKKTNSYNQKNDKTIVRAEEKKKRTRVWARKSKKTVRKKVLPRIIVMT